MPVGRGPSIPALTRVQRKVLADLLLFRDSRNFTELSYRQLAETTGRSRTGVWKAVRKLNDLELVRTVAVGRTRPAKHEIPERVLVQQQPVLSISAKAGRS